MLNIYLIFCASVLCLVELGGIRLSLSLVKIRNRNTPLESLSYFIRIVLLCLTPFANLIVLGVAIFLLIAPIETILEQLKDKEDYKLRKTLDK